MIKLMADSTCDDLSQEIVEKYNIRIAPGIFIEGKTYRDKIDITADEFLSCCLICRTSHYFHAKSEDYLTIIYQAMEEGYTEFLCICMSVEQAVHISQLF